MRIKIGGRHFELDAKICTEFEKATGLMFASEKRARALVFNFKKPVKLSIHSFFVFFPFLAIWLDGKNRIVCKKMVKPFSPKISPKREFSTLIEVPATEKYRKITKILVGKEKI